MTTNYKRVVKMMSIDPHCHWCGVEVVAINEQIIPSPENRGTVDHLYSRKKKDIRLKAMREGIKLNNGHKVYYVLSCYKCNHDRGTKGL